MQQEASRETKNSVFLDLFSLPEYQVQLVQALHPEMTDLRPEDIRVLTAKQVMSRRPSNDLSLLVQGRLMVFVEAQATWSKNLALRLLFYYVENVRDYMVDRRISVHRHARLELPEPEFYIIYTGAQQVPETISLRRDFYRSLCLRHMTWC